MVNQDLRALWSSEVFRNFVAIDQETKKVKKQASLDESLDAFLSFQDKVKSDPQLLKNFKLIKNKLASDPSLANQLDAQFIDALSLLDLEDE